jgi:hypothetical protein
MSTHLANAKLPVIHLSARTDTGTFGLEAENPRFWTQRATKNRLHRTQAGASDLCHRPADGLVSQI